MKRCHISPRIISSSCPLVRTAYRTDCESNREQRIDIRSVLRFSVSVIQSNSWRYPASARHNIREMSFRLSFPQVLQFVRLCSTKFLLFSTSGNSRRPIAYHDSPSSGKKKRRFIPSRIVPRSSCDETSSTTRGMYAKIRENNYYRGLMRPIN